MNTKIVKKPVFILGSILLNLAEELGYIVKLVTRTFYWIFQGSIDWHNTVIQFIEVGWNSFPVIALTSIFTGMVLALQTGSSSSNIFNEPIYIGTVVGFSLVKELGPVLTSIIVAGRVGASIAAEIGTMKVTEQLDALYTLGTNPIKYLAVPRFVACIIMVPILTLMANIIGVIGGLLVSMYAWNIPSTVYWEDIFSYMQPDSLFHGLIKSVVFGCIIVTVSCYKGFKCEGGAEGVGKATTGAVMIAMTMILISDYFLTAFLVAIGLG